MEDVGKEMSRIIKGKNYQEKYDKMVETVLNDPDVITFLNEHRDKLTQEDIEKSYAKLYEFVQEKRKFQLKDPSMIAPGYEPQLTMNFHYVDVTYVPTKELLARKEEETIRSRIRALDMPKDIQHASIKNFEKDEERSTALLEAMNFIGAFTEAPGEFHKGIYFVGDFGVGKTYLLGAIAHELAIRGYETTLIHFPTFAVEMKQAIAKDLVGEKLDLVKKAPVLMVDDIGADSMSTWIRDEIFGVILQYRMQEQLPTFFSSNFNMEDLEEHLSVSQRGEEEPIKAKRIMERIRYLTKEVWMSGRNRRNG